MLDFGGIDAAAVCQNPAFLLGIKGNLVAVKNRLEGFRHAIGQSVDQLVLFQGLADNINGVIGLHFLILNAHGLDGDHRRLGTEPVAAGGTNFNLLREALALDLIV